MVYYLHIVKNFFTAEGIIVSDSVTKKIVLTGGGSGGHVTSSKARIPALRNAGYDIYYIVSYKEKDITDANLEDAYYGESAAEYGLGSWEEDGIHDSDKSVTLNPVKMYLDPVICSKTFDVDGKKVGYLMYDSFDLDSAKKLTSKPQDSGPMAISNNYYIPLNI